MNIRRYLASSVGPEAYIGTEPVLGGSYEAKGHITRQRSADIHDCEVFIVLILTFIFITVVGRYVVRTKVDILQVNRQLLDEANG